MSKSTTYRFRGSSDIYTEGDSFRVGDAIGTYDRARMDRALQSEMIEMPQGLTREEKRQFILAHSSAARGK